MTTTLSQQLLDLCQYYGLTSISIHAYNTGNCDPFFGVNVHSGNALGYATGYDKPMNELFADAMTDLRAKQMIAVPVLAPMDVQAE